MSAGLLDLRTRVVYAHAALAQCPFREGLEAATAADFLQDRGGLDQLIRDAAGVESLAEAFLNAKSTTEHHCEHTSTVHAMDGGGKLSSEDLGSQDSLFSQHAVAIACSYPCRADSWRRLSNHLRRVARRAERLDIGRNLRQQLLAGHGVIDNVVQAVLTAELARVFLLAGAAVVEFRRTFGPLDEVVQYHACQDPMGHGLGLDLELLERPEPALEAPERVLDDDARVGDVIVGDALVGGLLDAVADEEVAPPRVG